MADAHLLSTYKGQQQGQSEGMEGLWLWMFYKMNPVGRVVSVMMELMQLCVVCASADVCAEWCTIPYNYTFMLYIFSLFFSILDIYLHLTLYLL